MDVRAQARFQADFPDDGVENESGVVLFPGKGLTTAIAEMLRRLGCEVSDPIDAGEHGWELDVRFQQKSLWCQVTWIDVDDCVLLFTDGVFMGNSSRKRPYLEAIAKLNLEMQRDPRFRSVRWFRWRGSEGAGADTPLAAELGELPKPARTLPRLSWLKKKTG